MSLFVGSIAYAADRPNIVLIVSDDQAWTDYGFMMHAVEQNEIAISAIWNFKPTGSFQADWDISPSNERAYMLDAVKALNERFAIGDWKRS